MLAQRKEIENARLPNSTASVFAAGGSSLFARERSDLMQVALPTLAEYDSANNTFRDFAILTRHTRDFNVKLASISAQPSIKREIILLDPSSVSMQRYSLNAKTKLPMNTNNVELSLQKLMEFVRQELRDANRDIKNLTQDFDALLQEWACTNACNPVAFTQKDGDIKIPVIPLDYIVERKTCFCRHYSFFVAFLLFQLIEAKLLPTGIVHHLRDRLLDSSHSWVLYSITEGDFVGKVFVVDPANFAKPLSMHDDVDKAKLKDFYGHVVYQKMVQRYLPLEADLEKTQEITREPS